MNATKEWVVDRINGVTARIDEESNAKTGGSIWLLSRIIDLLDAKGVLSREEVKADLAQAFLGAGDIWRTDPRFAPAEILLAMLDRPRSLDPTNVVPLRPRPPPCPE